MKSATPVGGVVSPATRIWPLGCTATARPIWEPASGGRDPPVPAPYDVSTVPSGFSTLATSSSPGSVAVLPNPPTTILPSGASAIAFPPSLKPKFGSEPPVPRP